MADDSSARRGLLRADDVEIGPAPVRVPTAGRKTPAPQKPAPGPEPCTDQPAVEVLRGPGGEVRAIVVQCTCGEQMTIECHYEEQNQ